MAGKKNKHGIDPSAVEAPELDLTIEDLADAEGTPTYVPSHQASAAPDQERPRTSANAPSLSMEVGPNVSVGKPTPQNWRNSTTTSKQLDSAIRRTGTNPFGVKIIFLALALGCGYTLYKFYSSGRSIREEGGKKWEDLTVVNFKNRDEAPAAPAVTAPPAAPGTIEIKTDVVGFAATANGQAVNLVDGRFQIPPGPVKLLISRLGFEDQVFELEVRSNETQLIRPNFVQAVSRGFLSYETVPDGTLTLSRPGQAPIVLQTPLDGASLPVGTYSAVLENKLIGYRHEENIEILEWKTTNLKRHLQSK